MYINEGCRHFVTVKSEMRAIEPVIAHEMTHGCVAHLPLPLWLNEGIAVNMERRLTGIPPALYTPLELHEQHLEFWGDAEVQEFWSGASFHRGGASNTLSYDLARILTEQLAKEWGSFKGFVGKADREDAGKAAARGHLGVRLGEILCALLERDYSTRWEPDPLRWEASDETRTDLANGAP